MKNGISTTVQSSSTTFSVVGDYVMLIKLRLSLTVVFTSLIGFLIANQNLSISAVVLLFTGGFLITGAANTFNQVLEKDFDKLMTRTMNRPLAAGRMKVSDAVLFGGILCVLGVCFLAVFNPLTAVIGMVSFLLYSFVYTPLKRFSPIAVLVGAVPGALPVLIGCTAAEGTLSVLAFGLFMIQFCWQFPHFWSISYLGHEDYNRAGYKIVPMDGDQVDKGIAYNSLFYTIIILPILGLLFYYQYMSIHALFTCIGLTVLYGGFGLNFLRKFDRNSALMLMFYSFTYMPAILLAILMIKN